jgi:hypothetical protein
MTTRARAQVVVVLTAGWQVLCYDHNLRLMWSRRIKARQAGEGQMRRDAWNYSALDAPPCCTGLLRPGSLASVSAQLRRSRRGGLCQGRALPCSGA